MIARQTSPAAMTRIRSAASQRRRWSHKRQMRKDIRPQRRQHAEARRQQPSSRRRSRRSARSRSAALRSRRQTTGSPGSAEEQRARADRRAASPSSEATTPRMSASSSSTSRIVSARSSRPAADLRLACRRWGTVSRIALNANRKPTSALIAENSSADWLAGPAAWLKSVASKLAGRTLRAPAARRISPSCTSRSRPGRGLARRSCSRAPAARELLGVGERRDRDGAVDERADVASQQLGAEEARPRRGRRSAGRPTAARAARSTARSARAAQTPAGGRAERP